MQAGQDNRRKAITIAVLLHVILAAILVLGIEFSDYKPLSGPKVEIIEAELVLAPPAAHTPKPLPEPPQVDPDLERLKQEQAEAERRRQAEEEQAQKAQEEMKRKEAEAQAQKKLEEKQKAEALAQQQAAEQKKLAEEQARLKAEAEQKRKAEEAARLKAEAEQKKKAEEEARKKKAEEEARQKAAAEQRAREQALLDALAQEQRERELNPLRAAYSAAISQQITRNWLKPPGISDNLKCQLHVVQLPDGSVTHATITKSSGNTVFDESVIKAVYKAAPLPQPPSPEVFDRELDITFCSTGNFC